MATFLVLEIHSGPQWDKSRPLEEQSDWPAHASFMDGLVESGFVVLGGPLDDVIALLRLNYERVVARHGLPVEAG